MKEHNFLSGKIPNCQICNSSNLIDVMKIGDQALANSLTRKKEDSNKVEKFPINIVRCKDCTLLQLDYIVDQNKVYHLDYPYLPGITQKSSASHHSISSFL